MCSVTTLCRHVKKTLFAGSIRLMVKQPFHISLWPRAEYIYVFHFKNVSAFLYTPPTCGFFLFFSKVYRLLRRWHTEKSTERSFLFWLQKNDCIPLPGQLCRKVRQQQTTKNTHPRDIPLFFLSFCISTLRLRNKVEVMVLTVIKRCSII